MLLQNTSLSVLLFVIPGVLAANPASPVHPYAIDLPGHVLRFELPRGIVSNMPAGKIETSVNVDDPTFQEKGYREFGRWLHDFNGPFWRGSYGSLISHLMVRKIEGSYAGRVRTSEELQAYLRVHIGKEYGFDYEQVVLNGVRCTRRHRTTFRNVGHSREKGEELEIFSFPLDEGVFLDIGFNIKEWVVGKARSWKGDAEKLRELVKGTIVLESRSREGVGMNRDDR